MKRFSGLAAIGRAIDSATTAVTSGSAKATPQHYLQAALYSSSFSSPKSRWSSHHEIGNHSGQSMRSAAHGVAGTMLFSVAASSLAEDVHAKELPQSKKFLPNDVVLYRYHGCPVCDTVKAFLDFYDIPYKIVEINPRNIKEIKRSDNERIPIVVVDGEQMVDSLGIIEKLFQRIHPEISVPSRLVRFEEPMWRRWAENHLLPVVFTNRCRTPSEALEYGGATYYNLSLIERIIAKYVSAASAYFASKKLKKIYNITDERATLYEAAETWMDALKGRHFLGGSKPNLADLAVFGVLRPIGHLKSGRDMVENTRIGGWYDRMESAMTRKVTNSCGLQEFSHVMKR